jgi:hypothetical protein
MTYDDVSEDDNDVGNRDGAQDHQGAMRSLELLRAFAVGWHSRSRDLNELYAELGADLIERPGGRKVLGFVVALAGLRQIVLNQRLNGSPLRVPVLAHECAHLILGVEGISLCANDLRPSRDERNAWAGAALLAVPGDALPRSRTARRQLAASLNVPVQLVDLRAALTECLDRPQPPPVHAYRRLSSAFERWYVHFHRASSRL